MLHPPSFLVLCRLCCSVGGEETGCYLPVYNPGQFSFTFWGQNHYQESYYYLTLFCMAARLGKVHTQTDTAAQVSPNLRRHWSHPIFCTLSPGVRSQPAIPSMLTCPLPPQPLAFLQTWEGGTLAAVAVCCEHKEPGDKGQGEAADTGTLETNWSL